MTEDRPAITAAGGWYAPPGLEIDRPDRSLTDSFPKVTVQRGGVFFPVPGSPEWEQAEMERRVAESVHQTIVRHVGDILTAQNAAIDLACHEALEHGYDVHVQRPPWSSSHGGTGRFIGIELAERRTGRAFPTLHEHSDDYRWWDLDDLD